MGPVPLLTREGEVEIAKRIERGKMMVNRACSRTLLVAREIIALRQSVESAEINLRELVVINDEEVTEQKIDERRQALVTAVDRIHRAYRECKNYAKRFAKIKKRSRGFVKSKRKLGRMRIELARLIETVEWTET